MGFRTGGAGEPRIPTGEYSQVRGPQEGSMPGRRIIQLKSDYQTLKKLHHASTNIHKSVPTPQSHSWHYFTDIIHTLSNLWRRITREKPEPHPQDVQKTTDNAFIQGCKSCNYASIEILLPQIKDPAIFIRVLKNSKISESAKRHMISHIPPEKITPKVLHTICLHTDLVTHMKPHERIKMIAHICKAGLTKKVKKHVLPQLEGKISPEEEFAYAVLNNKRELPLLETDQQLREALAMAAPFAKKSSTEMLEPLISRTYTNTASYLVHDYKMHCMTDDSDQALIYLDDMIQFRDERWSKSFNEHRWHNDPNISDDEFLFTNPLRYQAMEGMRLAYESGNTKLANTIAKKIIDACYTDTKANAKMELIIYCSFYGCADISPTVTKLCLEEPAQSFLYACSGGNIALAMQFAADVDDGYFSYGITEACIQENDELLQTLETECPDRIKSNDKLLIACYRGLELPRLETMNMATFSSAITILANKKPPEFDRCLELMLNNPKPEMWYDNSSSIATLADIFVRTSLIPSETTPEYDAARDIINERLNEYTAKTFTREVFVRTDNSNLTTHILQGSDTKVDMLMSRIYGENPTQLTHLLTLLTPEEKEELFSRIIESPYEIIINEEFFAALIDQIPEEKIQTTFHRLYECEPLMKRPLTHTPKIIKYCAIMADKLTAEDAFDLMRRTTGICQRYETRDSSGFFPVITTKWSGMTSPEMIRATAPILLEKLTDDQKRELKGENERYINGWEFDLYETLNAALSTEPS